MEGFFTAVGFAMSVVIVGAFAYGVIYWVKEHISEQIWIYKYRHRFDKPPKAECYCRDCCFYGDPKSERRTYCSEHKHYYPDNFFCKYAKPLNKETGLSREKEDEAS